MKTFWKDILWYEWKYQVSSLWQVRSLNYRRSWKIQLLILEKLKWRPYLKVKLTKNGIQKIYSVHRLVAQAFLWLNIDDKKMFVCHKDETLINWILNNSEWNLFLWTAKDNSLDCLNKWRNRHTLFKKWKLHPKSRKIIQYDIHWNKIKLWDSITEAWIWVWVYYSNIWSCCRWIQKTSWGYIWKYAYLKD